MPLLTVPTGDPLGEHGTKGDPDYPHPLGQGRRTAAPETAGTSYARPKVLQVRSIKEAIRLMHEGHAVELPDTRSVNTLLGKLAEIAKEAKAKGEQAPHYNLCLVSVANTNLFCTEKLRTAEHPEGIPRTAMPQFSGDPVPGSPADKLPKQENGGVDGAPAFMAHLKSLGIKTTRGVESAARLKATQADLVGAKVAGMMTKAGFDPRKKVIFVSRDHYVIDGHHRWAAAVGLDAADNELGQIKVQVIRVDAPISEILHIANRWTRQFGIATKSGKAA